MNEKRIVQSTVALARALLAEKSESYSVDIKIGQIVEERTPRGRFEKAVAPLTIKDGKRILNGQAVTHSPRYGRVGIVIGTDASGMGLSKTTYSVVTRLMKQQAKEQGLI